MKKNRRHPQSSRPQRATFHTLARTAGRQGIPLRPPTPEQDTTDDWSDIAGIIGMEDVGKIEEIISDVDNWGPPLAYQAPSTVEWNSPSPAVNIQPSTATPEKGIPVVVDPESAATAAALLPWLAIGLDLAKKLHP